MKVSQLLKLSAVALVLGVAPLQATFAHEHQDAQVEASQDAAPAEGVEAPAAE